MALLLGPAGVGLMGLYSSILEMTQSAATIGLDSSGVRQIADAAASGNAERVARTATVLRRISVVLGIVGAILLIAFARPLSRMTFGTEHHAGAVALLSIAVFFGSVTAGRSALVQGLRRIGDLARLGILGALFGTLVSVPLIYIFRERGIVAALIMVAALTSLTALWYSRKAEIKAVSLTTEQFLVEGVALLKLGAAFMASGLLTMGAAYVVRLIVVRQIGLDAAGLYQSAWVLGGLYVGFILQAMAADFYPRLTAVSTDNDECNRLVNEQAQISLLMAGPGILATLTFAWLVIALFYSAKFGAAVELLRWICLGMALRIISWPMGFIVLARGAQKAFFWTELAWTVVHVLLAWVCVGLFGLRGAGMAFFGSYIFHVVMIYIVVRRLSGFRWSMSNLKIAGLILPLIGIVFGGFYVLPRFAAAALGTVAVAMLVVFCLRSISRLVSVERIPSGIRRLLSWCRFAQ